MNQPHGPTRTLMLVHADPALRTVVQLHLGRTGYSILEAADEGAAFGLLRTTGVDVAVCAVHDARVDAAGCLRRLRAAPEPGVRHVPVLLLVRADTDPLVDALCATHGPAAALHAPYTGPRLAAAVERLLPGR